MDTAKSLSPLSVEIPPNHISSYSSSQRKGTSISSSNQSTPTTTKSSSKLAKPKIKESPSERSATGRKMRDCRKFIHYEFSPPFVSSESSVSEMDSPEQSRETFMKKLGRKKLRVERTQSMTDELLSPLVTSSASSTGPVKKRGRPVKSKSTDFREEITVLDEDSNTTPEVVEVVEEVKKKKRGRPPKKKPVEGTSSKISVSEMAENLSENQLCPITRDKMVFPLSSPNTEERKSKLISQQRESLMLRRHSDDAKKSRKARKLLRSKSMDVQSNPATKTESIKPEKEKDLTRPLRIEIEQCPATNEHKSFPNNSKVNFLFIPLSVSLMFEFSRLTRQIPVTRRILARL